MSEMARDSDRGSPDGALTATREGGVTPRPSPSPLSVESVPLTAFLPPQEPPKRAQAAPEAPAHTSPVLNAPRSVWGAALDESVLVVAPSSRKSGESALKARTYYRRKEEKEELEREEKGLQAQLEYFERRQGAKRQREAIAERESHNRAMRYAIRTQRLVFANTMSHISEFLRAQDHSKYEPTICLGTDPEERHEKLLRLKPQRLEEALGFLTERQRFMNRTTAFCDMQKFVSDNGDHCMVRFDIAPIAGARSVKQAFDAVLKFTYNFEIAISELMGNITLRLNEDVSWNSTIAQHRLVTTVAGSVEVDTNNVTFAEYQPEGGGGWQGGWAGGLAGKEVGVAACNFVDEDGLYPYDPARLRQNITFFVLVTAFPRSGASSQRQSSGDTGAGGDTVVVLSRWTCFRIPQPAFAVSDEELDRACDSFEQVGSAMLSAVRAACAPSSSVAASDPST